MSTWYEPAQCIGFQLIDGEPYEVVTMMARRYGTGEDGADDVFRAFFVLDQQGVCNGDPLTTLPGIDAPPTAYPTRWSRPAPSYEIILIKETTPHA